MKMDLGTLPLGYGVGVIQGKPCGAKFVLNLFNSGKEQRVQHAKKVLLKSSPNFLRSTPKPLNV